MTIQEFIDNFNENTGRLPSQVELSKSLSISPQKAIQALIAYTKEEVSEKKEAEVVAHKRVVELDILRWALSVISVMAFILSVYFTGLWFLGKFHFIISGMISLTMVMFMVIAPQTSRYVNGRAVKLVLWIAFGISMVFSMGSTIAGQYEKTSEALPVNNQEQSFSLLDSQEEEILLLIQDAREDKEVHQSTIKMLSASEEKRLENWEEIATERNKIDKYNEKIDIWTTSLGELRDKKGSELDVEVRVDFYSFIAGLTGKEASLIEFIVSAMPAVFLDIIAALCVNLALFLKETK